MERKEAIRILMGYSHTPEERAALETLIPELRESEDERILNGLIAAMKDQISCGGEFYFGMPLKDILAYLEKQKEQKPAEWKPSEEQMEALEYVIRDYREDSCNATANYLQEILDHLKNM